MSRREGKQRDPRPTIHQFKCLGGEQEGRESVPLSSSQLTFHTGWEEFRICLAEGLLEPVCSLKYFLPSLPTVTTLPTFPPESLPFFNYSSLYVCFFAAEDIPLKTLKSPKCPKYYFHYPCFRVGMDHPDPTRTQMPFQAGKTKCGQRDHPPHTQAIDQRASPCVAINCHKSGQLCKEIISFSCVPS